MRPASAAVPRVKVRERLNPCLEQLVSGGTGGSAPAKFDSSGGECQTTLYMKLRPFRRLCNLVLQTSTWLKFFSSILNKITKFHIYIFSYRPSYKKPKIGFFVTHSLAHQNSRVLPMILEN